MKFLIGEDGTVIQVGQTGNIELFNVVTRQIKTIATMQDLMNVIIYIYLLVFLRVYL